jgi:phosphoadenosine phosphosulfate reductase
MRRVTAGARALEPATAAGELERESLRLERATPEERLTYAVERFGDRLLFTSSFGAGSAVLLHMWSRLARGLPVVFIDTGFLFDETLRYKDQLTAALGLQVETVRPSQPRDEFIVEHGADIQATDPNLCCAMNKVAPLAPWLARADAWVSGLRRDQSPTRRDTPILLHDDEGRVKVHPLATMTAADVVAYMARHGLPEHPLRARRYLSIGCEPCTFPVPDGETDERAGRWAGRAKTECGLHAAVYGGGAPGGCGAAGRGPSS